MDEVICDPNAGHTHGRAARLRAARPVTRARPRYKTLIAKLSTLTRNTIRLPGTHATSARSPSPTPPKHAHFNEPPQAELRVSHQHNATSVPSPTRRRNARGSEKSRKTRASRPTTLATSRPPTCMMLAPEAMIDRSISAPSI
jgi:hypothetical protein